MQAVTEAKREKLLEEMMRKRKKRRERKKGKFSRRTKVISNRWITTTKRQPREITLLADYSCNQNPTAAIVFENGKRVM
jgi:hypothetical protein